jgi:predicted outer membrane repeat protein
VTILSGDLRGNDPSAFESPADHVYHVVSAYAWVDDTAVLDGFTVSGGIADGGAWTGQIYGGGLYNSQGSPTLRNLMVTGNRADAGGGMYSAAGAPTLNGVAFLGNHGTLKGGGLYVPSGAATLGDVVFEANTTTEGFGGGLAAGDPDDAEPPAPTLSLSRVAFRENVAQYGAGFGARCGDITIRDSHFERNRSTYLGGGMYVGDPNWLGSYVGALSLTGVAFRGNSAACSPPQGYESGGGMMLFDASPTLTNVVFSGNAAAIGAGIYTVGYEAPNPKLTNVTFNGNKAGSGGALYTDAGAPTVTNSILWGDGGGEIVGPATVTHSTVQGGYAGAGNSSDDPLFLTPVAAASAPTTAGNLRLQAGSPALDTGLTSAVPAGVTTDLDGCARIFGAAVDRGAYERSDSTPPTTSVSGADDLWHNQPVTLRFAASDGAGGSGVAWTEYKVDSGEWTKGTSVTIAAPAGGGNDGIHVVGYRSVDWYGNVETRTLSRIHIDTLAPSADDDHDGLWHTAFTLQLVGADGGSGVDHMAYALDGGAEHVITGASYDLFLRTWKRGGNSGVHRVDYRVVDRAGNETSGSCEVLLDGKAPVTTDDAPVDASGAPIPHIGSFSVHL